MWHVIVVQIDNLLDTEFSPQTEGWEKKNTDSSKVCLRFGRTRDIDDETGKSRQKISVPIEFFFFFSRKKKDDAASEY